jgi:nucleotide-binding universal stress UspA family protein
MLKDISLHLTGGGDDAARIAWANALSRRYGAEIVALYANLMPDLLAETDVAGSGFLQDIAASAAQAALGTQARLVAALDAAGASYVFRRLDDYPSTIGASLAQQARNTDLFLSVLPSAANRIAARACEDVLFGGGRACLFVPAAAAPPERLDTIVIAWKDCREAARAIAEAEPFLGEAREVVLLSASEGPAHETILSGMAGHLARHGVATAVHGVGGWAEPGEAILNEATRLRADLIVMGAYGHSRLRERVLGGATRTVLEKSRLPVLMAH